MTALHEEFAVPVDLPARNNKKRDLTCLEFYQTKIEYFVVRVFIEPCLHVGSR